MASTTSLQGAVRSATSLEEARNVWWPLMQELGWNRGKDDIKMHYHVAQDGKNWLLVTPEKERRPQGSLTALTYGNKTGWVCFFILNEAYRRQGLGRQLWSEMEAKFRVNQCDVIGLDGVEEQRATYERRGFIACAEIPVMTRQSIKIKPFEGNMNLEQGLELQDLQDMDPESLANLDFEHTGLYRPAYWSSKGVLQQLFVHGFAITRGSEITGLVMVRRAEHGHRIGPLFAATYENAKQLLHKAMNECAASDGSLSAEIFGVNERGRALFEELGWKYVGVSYHRMWLNGVVPPAQQESGKGAKGMYAIFDACCG